jgi:alkylhydroperoxidase family enzyme
MARIAYPRRETIPGDLARMLDEMPRHAPIDMLAHSPEVARQFLRLAQAQFTALQLPLRDRELLILAVAAQVGCEYEYRQHIPISEAAGVDPDLRESIWEATVDESNLPVRDRALLAFVGEVARSPFVDEDRLADARQTFSEREIVEMLQLIGFYWGLGRMCTVLDVEIETATDLTSVNAVANLSGRT